MTAAVLLCGSGLLADALEEELAGRELRRAPLNAPIPRGTRVVIAATAPADPRAEVEAQARALEAGASFFLVSFDGDDGFVGPWVRPGQPGCLACLRRRQWSARAKRAYFDRFEAGPVGGPGPGVLPLPAPAVHALAILAATALEEALQDRSDELVGRVFILSAHTLTGEYHRFVAVPACPHCAEQPADSADAGRLQIQPRPKARPRVFRIAEEPLDEERLRRQLYDWRTGVVTRISRQEASRRLACVWAYVPSPPGELHALGVGRGFSFGDSQRVALLEGLERYAGWEPMRRRTSVRGSFLELQPHAVDPTRLAQHAADESLRPDAPYVAYRPELEMNWVWGYSFRRQAPVLVPETCAYYRLPAAPVERPHNRFLYEISNGCALGNCIEEAVLHGLLEVIERDAFLMAWYARGTVPRLSPEGIQDRRILLLLDNLAADGYQVHIFDVSTEFGVPCLWVMTERGDGRLPATLSSAGAHFDPEKALLGALVEIASTLPAMVESAATDRARGLALVQDPTRVREMEDHGLLYAQPEAREWLEFLFRQQPSTPFRVAFRSWYEETPSADLTVDLLQLVGRVLAGGEDVWVVDQTPPEARPLGLQVVKVLVTGMLPMTFGYRFRRTDGVRRLNTLPQRLGWRSTPLSDDGVSPLPHPFP